MLVLEVMGVVTWTVSKLEQLCTAIIPHSDQYHPLQSAKAVDYLTWKESVLLIKSKARQTPEGLVKIVALKSALNKGLSDKLQPPFPTATLRDRPPYEPCDSPLDPNWLSGFTTGDGALWPVGPPAGPQRSTMVERQGTRAGRV
jgi:hypothetical protein